MADPYEWTNLAARKEMAAVIKELAGWLPTENKPGQAPSLGGLEDGERPTAPADRAERRKARQAK